MCAYDVYIEKLILTEKLEKALLDLNLILKISRLKYVITIWHVLTRLHRLKKETGGRINKTFDLVLHVLHSSVYPSITKLNP